jgi:UDP-sulfoquinovose synthase
MQAAIGHPLTVHGTGGQTRAFIHIQDTVKCIEIAIKNPPNKGDRVKIYNQLTETHRVANLAKLVANMTGVEISYSENPRNEAAENDLQAENNCFLKDGLQPTKLAEGLLEEVVEIAQRYSSRCNKMKIPCKSKWIKNLT